jgi:hypothetical protein
LHAMARLLCCTLVLPLLTGCLETSFAAPTVGWRFTLSALTIEKSDPAAIVVEPASLPTPTAQGVPKTIFPMPAVGAAPQDLASLLAYQSLQPRVNALRGMPPPTSTNWETSVSKLATELRSTIALLSKTDALAIDATPENISASIALALIPFGSPASRAFREAGDALATAIRARVLQGAAAPIGPGIASLDFGGGYAPPVFGSAGGGSGGSSAPAPVPTTGIDLAVTAETGGFMDPAATEVARVGP